MRVAFALLFVGASAGAQAVSVRGTAFDSLHGKPLAGAFIGIAGRALTAISDSAGHFTINGVQPGTHRFVMQHDVLDAIGLSGASTRATITDGRVAIVIAVPAFNTLWRSACGPVPPARDVGLVFGSVSRGGRPMPRVVVRTTWIEVSGDSGSEPRARQRTLETDADTLGNYALCGVPTRSDAIVRAIEGDNYSVGVTLPGAGRSLVIRRDIPMVVAEPAAPPAVPAKVMFIGRVRREPGDEPVADADVLLPGPGLSATTDARGEFRIAGVPAGRHAIHVRKIGYSFTEQQVTFVTDRVDRTLVVSAITMLDSVNVTARNAPRDEAMRLFDENRKLGFGKFFTRDDLETFRDRRMSDILGQLPGTKAQTGSGGQGWILPNRGTKSLSIGPGGGGSSCDPPKQDHPEARPYRAGPSCTTACFPHVFLDGVDISPTEVPNINRFSPTQIEAIEYYAGAAQIPPEYNRLNRAYCGVIVIHTRRGKAR